MTHRWMARLGQLRDDERGAVASAIVLFPLFAVTTFAVVQGLAWQHERQMAVAVADRTADAVALYGSSPGAAQADAVADLTAAGLDDVSVSVSRGGTETVVVVSGRAPGIMIGTSVAVSARAVTPSDGYVSP
jgi:hypothetical protein